MTVKIKDSSTNPKQKTFDLLYKNAFLLKQNKEYVKAIEAYTNIIAQHKEDTDIEYAKLYEDIGDIFYELKDFLQAFENMQKALHIYADNQAYDLQLQQYKKIGGLQQSIWQFKKSIEIFEQGLSLANRINKKDKIVEFELLLGNVLNWADQLPQAKKYLQSAIQKEKKLSNADPLVKLRAHVSYAILLRKMKKYKEAERYFRLGMKFSAENNGAYLSDIMKSYGIMQYEIGNYKEAEELLLDSEQKLKIEGSNTTRGVVYEYLALLYEHKKDFEKAYDYIKKYYEVKLELLEKGYSDDNNILHAKIGLEDAKRERLVAEETAKAKSLFIASISHEIRTPMNIILGTTSLMLNDNPNPEHVRYLQTLKKSGENMLGIINDILDVSKMEAGKLEIEYEPIRIQEVFENILTTMEQSAADKQLSLSYSMDSKLDLPILSDALRLTQIITNLVSNAIKFTSEGKIHYEAKLISPEQFCITVSDTGIGIPRDKLKSIFEQYEQVKSPLQRKYKGTGLGLAISKKLVEMMNGTISIKSKVNKGTTFEIVFPLQIAPSEEQEEVASYSKKSKFLSNKKILIVDDIADNRFVIKETLLLFNKHIQIIEAENGKAALDLLQTQYADLVFMDLDMPVMNGFDALNEIRKDKKLKSIKIIASTANVINTGEHEFIELGFDAFLPKPFTIDQLYQLVEKIFRK